MMYEDMTVYEDGLRIMRYVDTNSWWMRKRMWFKIYGNDERG